MHQKVLMAALNPQQAEVFARWQEHLGVEDGEIMNLALSLFHVAFDHLHGTDRTDGMDLGQILLAMVAELKLVNTQRAAEKRDEQPTQKEGSPWRFN